MPSTSSSSGGVASPGGTSSASSQKPGSAFFVGVGRGRNRSSSASSPASGVGARWRGVDLRSGPRRRFWLGGVRASARNVTWRVGDAGVLGVRSPVRRGVAAASSAAKDTLRAVRVDSGRLGPKSDDGGRLDSSPRSSSDEPRLESVPRLERRDVAYASSLSTSYS